MAGVNAVLEFGPDSRQVSAPVTGGQLVMPDPADNTGKGLVIPTTGPVTTCLGQATIDARPKAEMGTDMSALRDSTSIRYAPMDTRCNFLNAVADGQLCVAASAGQLQKYIPGTHTPDQVVARCTEPGGVTAGAVQKRARML